MSQNYIWHFEICIRDGIVAVERPIEMAYHADGVIIMVRSIKHYKSVRGGGEGLRWKVRAPT